MLKDDYKVNLDNSHKIINCQCSSLITNSIGTATCIMRDYILSLFPDGYFKTVYIDTQLPTFEAEEESSNVYKKSKPALTISPRLVFKDDTQLQYVPDWTTATTYIYGRKDKYYANVLRDEQNNVNLWAIPDRVCIDFEIGMIFSTRTMQINAAYHLKHSMQQRTYIKLHDQHFDAEIPKYIIHALAKSLNVDMTNEDEILNFIHYLNNNSGFKITRKKNLSSGRVIYTYSCLTNIIFLNDEYPDLDDGENKSLVKDNFKVSFRLNTEFWSPSSFILETVNDINFRELEEFLPLNEDTESINHVTAFHSVQFAPVKDIEDKKLFLWESYITDEDESTDKTSLEITPDRLNISSLLGTDTKRIIKYCMDHKEMDISEYLIIHLYKNSQKLSLDKFYVDWNNLEIVLSEPLYGSVYHFAGYINYEKAKILLEKIEGNKNEK